MDKIYFITGNENKLIEAKEFIPEIKSININLTEIQSTNPKDIIKHKLEEAKKNHEGNKFIVDDVSLYLEGMKDLPGPLIKFFEKSIGIKGIVELTKIFGNKTIVRGIIGYYNNGKIEYFEGNIKGIIVEPRGDKGFGWDPIFQPEGYEKTFAEMTLEEKNKISHRKIAFQKLKEYLENENSKSNKK